MSQSTQQLVNEIAPMAQAKSRTAKQRDLSHVFTALLFALFLLTMLLSISAGTNLYRALYDTSTAADNERLGMGLMVNTVRANDALDAVAAGSGPEGQSLVLTETVGTDSYETRLYLYEGYVVQEYSLAGSAYTPQRATQLVESSQFSFTYKKGLLSITTDQGTSQVALRSVGGGA